jgi:hypothetical protein
MLALYARDALLRAAREMDRYIDAIEEPTKSDQVRTDYANAAINTLAQVTGNLRISDLARCQAELTKLA